MFDKFMNRHIGVTNSEDLGQMLKVIGVESVEELISQVIPASIRLKKPLALPEGMSEYEFTAHVASLAAKNRQLRSFIGMGYYPTAVPAVVSRNVFENPAWYTSYTPYQAEISQGRLEALLNFQTAILSLTGMQIANCSLLDEATAAAEAMLMMYALRSREAVKQGRNQLFVDKDIFPQTLDVLLTRSEPFGIELIIDDYSSYEFTGMEFGALVQYPSASGAVRDYAAFAEKAHAAGALVAAAADILSLAILTPPAEWGADIAVGSTQRLGCPMGFGGPSAGYMACREAYKRNIPGRIIGVSVDRLGNKALRMSLQMREQHIKREKATSNICTASALMASMAGFYCIYNGPKGVRRAALTAHTSAVAVKDALEALGYKVTNKFIFDTVEVEAEAAVVQDIALAAGFNFYYPSEGLVRLSCDEVTTEAEVEAVVAVFAEAKGRKPKSVKVADEVLLPTAVLRSTPILEEPVFNKYHSESDMMRYIKQLELRDISLANSMISLGSCTMKLNAAAIMQPLSLAGFQNMHPFAPADQSEGYTELIAELEKDLATITGFAGCSLQPNSGAAGEYTGLMVIRAYHQSRGQGYRNIILIPASAHGTNPASAAMAGMKIVTVACDQNGNIDVEDLKAKAEEHSSELCGLMVTYPSTHGVFESRIREIVDAVHDAGGQVYMDGANMNAQVGLTNPGYIGADVCHLNLHKTFAMPHGGGGPGVGPICVAEHLTPFLPSHSVMTTGGEDGITAVASSPWGSAMLLPITYGYIKMLGEEGLRHATEMAIVNANYMSSALKSEYRTFYSGETGRVGHEMILDLTNFKKDYGIDCGDIAHRLMDYGFHAPTLSFPVHETLMVEPTESEPKAEMDRFMEALVQIKRECEAAAASGDKDNVVVNAPHTAVELAGEWSHPYSRMEAAFPLDWVRTSKFFPYVTKIDNGYGDRNLVCCNVD
ncbi:MAG: aminomethyl-transferring glycine dehydrogenase [Alistipes sp.]|nr:aminomethyl-transferring glycine dehydrogenase [Alistipes sp.]MBO5276497.1 aminomethyl-transferring glycine dehydrogenase [Alistipes sp.]MBO5332055.1 aminomethyl-transferring glycine dehydrogenase [Alistipes sp.]MBO5399467.1 aminomethyl-transferring glycine dehydrogenase [Alistipes sp.]MBP3473848.1 aminomethyl-transferring glycine dehydrogenase [Alistipes sp.]